MFKHVTTVLALTTALAATPYAQSATGSGKAAPAQTLQSAFTDSEFLKEAARANEAEIALAALAQKQATDPRVKSVADALRRDHEATRTEIQKLAKRRNVEISAMTVGQLAAHNRLEKMSGADFDRAWVTEIIELHRDTRGLYSRATRSADAEIKTLATLQATNLEDHLKRAKALQGEVK